jgi:hypothetical protein
MRIAVQGGNGKVRVCERLCVYPGTRPPCLSSLTTGVTEVSVVSVLKLV